MPSSPAAVFSSPTRSNKRLRLSLFTVPELSIGRAPLTPQNSQFDARRLTYLEGMVNYLNSVFDSLQQRHSHSEAVSRVEALLQRLPYSELVQLDATRKPSVTETPDVRDTIVFNHERLKILFPDGFHRGARTPAIPAGRYSPQVAHVISKLSQGASEADLSRQLDKCDVDLLPVINGLRDLQLIKDTDPSAQIVPQSLLEGHAERLTWLGHACVLFQTSRSSICVDPFLRPHINWTDEDLKTCFSDSFVDRLFFEPYGPELTQFSPAQLPPLDAVFVTHQDIDHCNLGVLMMLPESVPIVVPDCRPDRAWEVDLSALIRNVLGRRRKVIRLRHGETMTIGDLRATAFPFVGEMPSSLQTSWNCYLFETEGAAVACTADSAVTDESVDFLIQGLGRGRKPLVLCSQPVHSGRKLPGHREELESLFNFTRLWAWYVPVWDLFQPVEELGISEERLRRLSARTNLRFYLPYAMGAAPWYRIADDNDPLHIPMNNLSARQLRALADMLAAIPHGPSLFPGKFARPFPVRDA